MSDEMPRGKVRCKTCNCTGWRELTKMESDTLKAVGTEWSSTGEIRARLFKVQGYWTKPTALCNRLVTLGKNALVERRPLSGKDWAWRTVQ